MMNPINSLFQTLPVANSASTDSFHIGNSPHPSDSFHIGQHYQSEIDINGHIIQVGHRTTRDGAKEWEDEQRK